MNSGMMKFSDFKEEKCKVCGGYGKEKTKYLGNTGADAIWEETECPTCKGKGTRLHATLTDITVNKDNNLIEEWSE
jgi:DnaJ-class molecular chaperone